MLSLTIKPCKFSISELYSETANGSGTTANIPDGLFTRITTLTVWLIRE